MKSTQVRRASELLDSLASLRGQSAELEGVATGSIDLFDECGELVTSTSDVPDDVIEGIVARARAEIAEGIAEIEAEIAALGIEIDDAEPVAAAACGADASEDDAA